MNKLKLSLFLSLFCVFVLIAISQNIPPKKIPLGKIEENNGKFIEISGVIEKLSYQNNKISVYLENCETEIIIFSEKIPRLKNEENITVTGRISRFKDNYEIIAEKISRL